MEASDRWQPWDDSKQETAGAFNQMKPVSGPPCTACKHWKPQVQFIHTALGFMYDGVRCCHSEDMHHDFSCFRVIEL